MQKNRLRRRPPRQANWRSYQSRLKKADTRKRRLRKCYRAASLLLFMAILFYGVGGGPGGAVHHESEPPKDLSKKRLSTLLDAGDFVNIQSPRLDLTVRGERMVVKTGIDPQLQNFILAQLDTRHARYIGVVVISPYSGRIRAMVGYDRENPNGNPCADRCFPAASIFKIVTAAAAVEQCGMAPHTPLTFRGGKYTLYKYQLRQDESKNVRTLSLKDSFAQSVNPIFGKLGMHYLQKKRLKQYALAFGFNRLFRFELPMAASRIQIQPTPYHWAEIACGFNRETVISPLHGALIASAVFNGGYLMNPILVDQVTDGQGRVLYHSRITALNKAIRPPTAVVLRELMQETIKSGTCKKTFRGHEKDPVLSRLVMGGKTGTINSHDHAGRRFDWFVGFAQEKGGMENLVISAFVAHEKYIGPKANYYGRLIMKDHFARYFARQDRKQLTRANQPASEVRD